MALYAKQNKKLLIIIITGVIVGLILSFITVKDVDSCTVVGTGCYELEKAQDSQSRTQGLSGRKSMGSDQGMLFIFDNAGEQCIWMKDMNFALDMIWLNNKGKVVHIEENVSPDTYPQNFCSASSAKYVIELNAGSIKDAELQLDDVVVIN